MIVKKAIQFCIFMAMATSPAACTMGFENPGAVASSSAKIVRADVPHLLAENHVTSVSIATIRSGQFGWTAAYGQQREGKPATIDTLYNIASLSKPLTAEIVLRLAAKGQLSL